MGDCAEFKSNWKPAPGSGRLERRKRKAAAKRDMEPETYAETLARVEFWRDLREQLYLRDGGTCRACGLMLDPDALPMEADSLQSHHLVHKSAGGLDVIDNLASLCRGCHLKHHDGLLDIGGTPATLDFVSRNRKGQVTHTWQSALRGE